MKNIPAVKAEKLTKYFDNLCAVNSIGLSVSQGEIYGLIGPDGAGKTTVLRMLAGILTPDSGQAFIQGYSSVNQQEELKDSIAYMSQKFGLYQDLTVYENIRFYADLYNVPKNSMEQQIDSLLDFSYMKPFKKRRAGNLSGGMKQKLQLICALIHKPKVLLLDEPTNGVDPVSRRDFWRILYKLLSDGVTILVSTAYLDEAERCSRIGLINEGTIISEGTPAEVMEKSKIQIVNLSTTNNKKEISEVKKLFRDNIIHLYGESIRIQTENPEDTISVLKKHYGADAEIYESSPHLEDIFMSLQNRNDNEEKLISMVSDGVQKKTGSSVSTDSLTKRFGTFTAANNITIDVKYGEIFGFLGPNGAGKSTTIKMLCGLLPPTEGNGTVAGYDIVKKPEKIKESIGYMSQKFSLYEDLKVYENIDFYGGIYGLYGRKLQKRRDWALELAGLSDRKKETTANLTGGWRQRLALACSILHSPSVVFLDEPTSGADPSSRRLFWEIINNLAEHGVTVFVSTHYMEEAEYCDRLAMIFRGNMVAQGPPSQLKKENMTGSIINISINSPQDYLEKISRISSVKDAALFGAGMHVRTENPEKAEKEIRQALAGIDNVEIKMTAPSMEDVFVSLIEDAKVNDER